MIAWLTLVPDLKILTAHGKMSATELDQAMTDFGDGAADVNIYKYY